MFRPIKLLKFNRVQCFLNRYDKQKILILLWYLWLQILFRGKLRNVLENNLVNNSTAIAMYFSALALRYS